MQFVVAPCRLHLNKFHFLMPSCHLDLIAWRCQDMNNYSWTGPSSRVEQTRMTEARQYTLDWIRAVSITCLLHSLNKGRYRLIRFQIDSAGPLFPWVDRARMLHLTGWILHWIRSVVLTINLGDNDFDHPSVDFNIALDHLSMLFDTISRRPVVQSNLNFVWIQFLLLKGHWS